MYCIQEDAHVCFACIKCYQYYICSLENGFPAFFCSYLIFSVLFYPNFNYFWVS